MSTEKTEGLVIRLADFSETSRVVTLFTRDWGKVSALAKGGRRLNSSFEAALDLLTACRIVFIRKLSSSLDILTEAQLISRFRPLGRKLNGYYAGYYVAELLSGLTEDYDPHPVLYDEAIKTLAHLSEGIDVKLPVLRFELITLREIGQLPAFDVCVVCNRPFQFNGGLAFWGSQRGLVCSKCRKTETIHNRVQSATLAILRYLTEESKTIPQNLAVSPQQFREIRRVVTAAISHSLERRPKMLKFLKF